ncbi:MAG: hypothetical protein VYB91_00405 [Pseudomonadota bacterium]|nr:hypothetical protein [Pseudomonadota bacterium]MED5323241.1 hypothetical protein [Pseudomonadota bacterium]
MSAKPTLPVEALSLNIDSYVACTKCVKEVADIEPKISLQDYAAIDVGFTNWGLQIWCRRHQVNIVHIDFGGAQLPADFRRLEKN